MTRPVLHVLSGLPGAGKSTRARQVIAQTGAVLVARDELRAAFVSLDCEGTITDIMAGIARSLLERGRSVVVDAWNLHSGDRDVWRTVAREAGAEVHWEHLATPVDECVHRDAPRPNPNGAERVRAVAAEYADSLRELAA